MPAPEGAASSPTSDGKTEFAEGADLALQLSAHMLFRLGMQAALHFEVPGIAVDSTRPGYSFADLPNPSSWTVRCDLLQAYVDNGEHLPAEAATTLCDYGRTYLSALRENQSPGSERSETAGADVLFHVDTHTFTLLPDALPHAWELDCGRYPRLCSSGTYLSLLRLLLQAAARLHGRFRRAWGEARDRWGEKFSRTLKKLEVFWTAVRAWTQAQEDRDTAEQLLEGYLRYLQAAKTDEAACQAGNFDQCGKPRVFRGLSPYRNGVSLDLVLGHNVDWYGEKLRRNPEAIADPLGRDMLEVLDRISQEPFATAWTGTNAYIEKSLAMWREAQRTMMDVAILAEEHPTIPTRFNFVVASARRNAQGNLSFSINGIEATSDVTGSLQPACALLSDHSEETRIFPNFPRGAVVVISNPGLYDVLVDVRTQAGTPIPHQPLMLFRSLFSDEGQATFRVGESGTTDAMVLPAGMHLATLVPDVEGEPGHQIRVTGPVVSDLTLLRIIDELRPEDDDRRSRRRLTEALGLPSSRDERRSLRRAFGAVDLREMGALLALLQDGSLDPRDLQRWQELGGLEALLDTTRIKEALGEWLPSPRPLGSLNAISDSHDGGSSGWQRASAWCRGAFQAGKQFTRDALEAHWIFAFFIATLGVAHGIEYVGPGAIEEISIEMRQYLADLAIRALSAIQEIAKEMPAVERHPGPGP